MGDTQNDEVRYHFDARAFGTNGVAIIRRLASALVIADRELAADGHDLESCQAAAEAALAAHDLAMLLARIGEERLALGREREGARVKRPVAERRALVLAAESLPVLRPRARSARRRASTTRPPRAPFASSGRAAPSTQPAHGRG